MNHNYFSHGEVKANRGKVYKYLWMTFYFTKKSKVKINMDDYVETIINELPMKIGKSDVALTTTEGNM